MDLPEDRDRAPPRELEAAEQTTLAPTTGLVVGHPAPGGQVGQVLGGRYQIRAFLGRGGMGEVWRALDLKLRVEVALKALRPTLASDAARLELLRQEVRAAREVTSQNVCRVYDLVELDGRELVSMEYVDGTTLLDVLREKAPLDPPEAQGLASQFLAGLEAIHKVGLVHRDVKPENIMVTRTGRAVLMDFGLARSPAEGAGSVGGTRAYMAPEQARGEADSRSDLFSAGVVLAEMVSPRGLRDFESRQSVWNGIRAEPVGVPDSPWAPVVRKAVAKDPADRFQSVGELMRALEDVAFRVHDETGLVPYPGLASFTEADAEYFFGREAEVEAVWTKLQSAQLLGVIGASGSGKSSFLGAGLIPAKPEGWAVVRCTPGTAAVDGLRRGIYAELQGSPDAVHDLASGGDSAIVRAFGRWRQEHEHALLIVDQFEELFTQNGPEEQARFAGALGKLTLDADVHVVLAMRDDFFVRCNQFDELRPMYSELQVLDPPRGSALRRAVVQPALRCGYRFEDEQLADEILTEVEGERGALPLLAFALTRLWEKRDRESGRITRQAYREIGGVGGALAQHAEALMERLGPERHGIVREIFRNLVTAQGTRAARDTDELLSVFRDNRGDAAEVLRALIDARLLTSYEMPSDTGPGAQRAEVIHESLISRWPRLVGWRTQDADSARLRDELRQAARQWQEHGRTDDRLWTGTAFKEYEVWRERYPGGLTELEDSFAGAMDVAATRTRRRRRIAVAASFTILLVVLAVVASLWRRSLLETRRAEASKLLAVAQLRLGDHPNAALAYAVASLEHSDTDPARRFALEALWRGPPAIFFSDRVGSYQARWSADGKWLAVGGTFGLELVERETGAERQLSSKPALVLGFSSDGRRLVTPLKAGSTGFEVWSLPEGRLERTLDLGNYVWCWPPFDDRLVTVADDSAASGEGMFLFHRAALDGTTHEMIGPWQTHGPVDFDIDPSGTWISWAQEGQLLQQRLDALSLPPRVLGTDPGGLVTVRPWSDRVVVLGQGGEVRIWDALSGRPERTLKTTTDAAWIALDPKRRFLATCSPMALNPRSLVLFDLAAPRIAEPTPLLGTDWPQIDWMTFSPDGSWLLTVHEGTIILWNMAAAHSILLGRHEAPNVRVGFTRDGHLLSSSDGGVLRRWPLAPAGGENVTVLWSQPSAWLGYAGESMEVDRQDRFVVAADGGETKIHIVPLDGSAASTFQPQFPSELGTGDTSSPSLDPTGRLIAVTLVSARHPELTSIRIRDLVTGSERTLDTHPQGGTGWGQLGTGLEALAFSAWLPDGRLVTDGDAGLRVWDLADGTSRLLRPAGEAPPEGTLQLRVSADGRSIVRLAGAVKTGSTSSLSVFDLISGVTREITSHGRGLVLYALDSSGKILVTGDRYGVVRVGPLTGEEPHLLYGHAAAVTGVAVSPDGRWIASGSNDGTIRLWPMPDLSKPPLHTLPHDELLATLRSLTNLRAVRDPNSDTGWKIEIGSFPGWAVVPEWSP